MNSRKQNLKYLSNVIFYIVALGLSFLIIPKIIVFFMPFIIGWIMSLVANPVVMFLEKKLKIKRKAGTVFVIIFVIALVGGIGYSILTILARQLAGFINEIPDLWAGVEADFTNLGDFSQKHLNFPAKWREPLNSVGNYIGEKLSDFTIKVQDSSLASVSLWVENFANIIISVIMTFLSAYFFTADHETIMRFYRKYMPENIKNKLDLFHRSFAVAIGGYFKAQIKIEIWIYFLLLIGLTILGVNYSFLFALLIAILDFLPVFGTGAVMWPWTILKIISGEYFKAAGFMVIWGLGQLVRQLIQPKIMGESVGFDALPTLFLLFLGFKFGGVGGMIIAIPVGIIFVNMYEAHWFDSFMYSIKMLYKNFNDYRHIDIEDKDNEDKINQ